jgi:hypothetical protein
MTILIGFIIGIFIIMMEIFYIKYKKRCKHYWAIVGTSRKCVHCGIKKC